MTETPLPPSEPKTLVQAHLEKVSGRERGAPVLMGGRSTTVPLVPLGGKVGGAAYRFNIGFTFNNATPKEEAPPVKPTGGIDAELNKWGIKPAVPEICDAAPASPTNYLVVKPSSQDN